ncbi:hypothetical protein FSP39_005854 [Pinctada imbricata]|uniref:Pappalysin-1 SD scarf domain-containing protein n=1 Tax=Pinctada imbricata TaxID=66713 RepID=A0AA88YMM7_PINIB|nr:hypothetical protein FSP39_005854 [Pinctada imbricata]
MQTHMTDKIRITLSPRSDGKFTEIDAVSVLGFAKLPESAYLILLLSLRVKKGAEKMKERNEDGRSSANQIKGPPDVYPNYGDSVGAWKQAAGQVMCDCNSPLGSATATTISDGEEKPEQVKFGKAVFVEEIRIYETLNCGAVKQIQALSPGHKWVTVWETADVEVITHSRIFIPEFKVKLNRTIFLKRIFIYETNNGGGVTAIQGFYFNGLWQTIWSKGMTENISGSRIFAPEFKMQTQKTDQIRITISSNPDGKFTEIDAVSALGFDKIPGKKAIDN